MTRILVVEDEESYRDPLTYQLTREGFDVVEASSGTQALELFDAQGADLVLLDLMLPGLSGTEVCRQLRLRSDVPVIMLTAKDTEIDKVVGLELGADDYVTKPYSFRELLARMRAVMRRRSPVAVESSGGNHALPVDDDVEGVLDVGPVRMDVDRHTVTVGGHPVALPLKEFDLLELLLRNAGRVLTRGQLIDRVWGADYVGDTKTLDVHVKRIRAKIEPDPGSPRYLLTVRGLGYKLADSDA
ncbi:MAG: response regulator transcription factor [Promicromonosporaceae bacterium]|nr:response regulator transcription factor [Promicromonosporaceae bacterium]